MNAALVGIRTVHFAACVLLAGELAFVAFVAGNTWRQDRGNDRALDMHVRLVAACACVTALVSGCAWVVVQATTMSGSPLDRVLGAGLVGLVLRETSFGHVFALRGAIFVALVASLVAFALARGGAARMSLRWIALVIAALELVTLAFAGHAEAAGGGRVGIVHVGADMVHLAAAGAWVGALPALVFCLGRRASFTALAHVTRRFSVLGVACVALLIASGIVNTLFLVGSLPALFGTRYGRWLTVKLGVFVVMLGLAAVNRQRLAPRIVREDATAPRTLRRNAILETACGGAIVAIVGALGTMIPGAHRSPVWPFPYTFDLDADGAVVVAWGSALVAAAGVALIIAGMRRSATHVWLAGATALALAAVAPSSILAVPAYPTTYATSPVPYTVDAIAQGAGHYAAQCARCHGAKGHGDGVDAASLAVKPMNLAEHALHHPAGNLFWWIARGIADTPMPAFSPQLPDTSIWQIVQYLIARASGEAATAIASNVDSRSTVEPPDFSYEVSGQGQRTLRAEAVPTLIVLYSTPASDPRLTQLAQDHRLMHARLRIVVMALKADAATGTRFDDVRVEPAAANVYAMFATRRDGVLASHAELLVDGAGILRARWLDLPAEGADRDAQIADALRRLPAIRSKPTPSHHGH